jgi:putative NIF3 family GTP cyclohydrolase 1 type 2
MKLTELYKQSVQHGIDSDMRSKKDIDKLLKKQKEKLDGLKGKKKQWFNEDRLWNPYHDCCINFEGDNPDVKTLAVGIDIHTEDLLLVDHLNAKGAGIDAVMVHHPEGRALGELDKVMPLEIDILASHGVPENISEGLLASRRSQVFRSFHARNLLQTDRAAELLNIPLIGMHTVTDNLAWQYVEKHICSKQWDDLGSIVDALNELGEYDYYASQGNPAFIVHGKSDGRPGKVAATGFTGGTNGPEGMIAEQAKAGVGTILTMHVTEKEMAVARKHHINIIQCSHMGSDAMGINLLLDKFPKIKTVDLSGFVRVKR